MFIMYLSVVKAKLFISNLSLIWQQMLSFHCTEHCITLRAAINFPVGCCEQDTGSSKETRRSSWKRCDYCGLWDYTSGGTIRCRLLMETFRCVYTWTFTIIGPRTLDCIFLYQFVLQKKNNYACTYIYIRVREYKWTKFWMSWQQNTMEWWQQVNHVLGHTQSDSFLQVVGCSEGLSLITVVSVSLPSESRWVRLSSTVCV